MINKTKRFSLRGNLNWLGLTFFSLVSLSAIDATAMPIDEQRVRYRDAHSAFARNDMSTFDFLSDSLKDYPLHPYLEYKKSLSHINQLSVTDVQSFEKKHRKLPFVKTIRSRYLDHLAKNERWEDFLKLQTVAPRSESGKCYYYYAKSQTGHPKTAVRGARALYLSGHSISNACDKLFENLKKSGGLTEQLILDRMLLAFRSGDKHLLNYLNKQLKSKTAQQQGRNITSLYDKPEDVAEFSKKSRVTKFNQTLTEISFKRLSRQNVKEAVDQFTNTVEGQHFKSKKRQELADGVINRLMSSKDNALISWRDRWLKTTQNTGLLERRFRLALTADDWQQMAFWISKMPKATQKDVKWQYWLARIEEYKGNKKQAEKMMRELVGQRHFYSVAAAVHVDQPIQIPYKTDTLNKDQLKAFQPAIARVKEFLALNEIVDAKREWEHLLLSATQKQKSMLAAYAIKNNWYHLAVQATISGKLWGHLEFRFPLAYRWWFEFFSKERELPVTTLLALSRQESAFYSSAQSPVGARGLMQLMPRTAKETSKKLGLRFQGNQSLTDPAVNISIGSGYLRMLLNDYDDNRILAFAAYNAGPHRVKNWLERSDGNLDAIAFIEAIPFYETRGYVQNVLMYDIYYRKLLGQPIEFLKQGESARAY